MNAGPRVVGGNHRFRVVRTDNATYIFEKADGADALGVERWRELKFGEAHDVAKLLRDYIIELLRAGAKDQGDAEDF